MRVRIKKIDRRLRQARAVLADAAGAFELADSPSFDAWCNELIDRLTRVERELRELKTAAHDAFERREMDRLRTTHPR